MERNISKLSKIERVQTVVSFFSNALTEFYLFHKMHFNPAFISLEISLSYMSISPVTSL